MKFIAMLMMGYLVLGYSLASWIKHAGESASSSFPQRASLQAPFWQAALPYVLLAIIVALPFIGFRQAKRKGEFLRLNTWQWVAMPLGSLLSGAVLTIWY